MQDVAPSAVRIANAINTSYDKKYSKNLTLLHRSIWRMKKKENRDSQRFLLPDEGDLTAWPTKNYSHVRE